MHIVNAMFSKGLGGIEQALVDYCEALKMQGHKVTAIISPKAKIKESLLPLGVNIIEIKNFSAWDFFAMLYIKKIMKQLAPDAVIVHGNRAVSLVSGGRWAVNGFRKHSPLTKHYPLIGVTHNYSIKRLIGLDAILATTNDLKAKVIASGQADSKVFKLPNMVRIQGSASREQRENTDTPDSKNSINSTSLTPTTHPPKPIIIGTMGRFVKKKGFDVFIRSMADLKASDFNFKAVIGGGGEEEENLKNLATLLLPPPSTTNSPDGQIEFVGWVKDKAQFFDNIDIFCLPSLHEPFGIILLEAFAYKKPVVVANSEGPSEIVSNNEDAMLVPKGDSKAMADAIIHLSKNPEFAEKLAQNAFAKAAGYDIKHFAESLNNAILQVLKNQ